MLLAFVQCDHETTVAEYEIKADLIDLGNSYQIKSKTNAPTQFSIRNKFLSVPKKFFLLENGKEVYIAKNVLTSVMSTWRIKEAGSGKELGTIENKLKFTGSEMTANGAFGNYRLEGNFGNHEFTIMKDGTKVAAIEKKIPHIHDTYDLRVYGDADRALMVLFTVIVDEIL